MMAIYKSLDVPLTLPFNVALKNQFVGKGWVYNSSRITSDKKVNSNCLHKQHFLSCGYGLNNHCLFMIFEVVVNHIQNKETKLQTLHLFYFKNYTMLYPLFNMFCVTEYNNCDKLFQYMLFCHHLFGDNAISCYLV